MTDHEGLRAAIDTLGRNESCTDYAQALGAGCSLFVDLAQPTITLGLATDATGSWTSPFLSVAAAVLALTLTHALPANAEIPANASTNKFGDGWKAVWSIRW